LICVIHHDSFAEHLIFVLYSCLYIHFLFYLAVIKARLGIREVHFLPFNPTDKRTALTYIDRDGKMHRVSKGAPEQVLSGIVLMNFC